jgi:hypothetical protein
MSRLKLKQVLSNMNYNVSANQLTITGSSNPSLIISGSVEVTSSNLSTGSLTIKGVDTFGDSGSFFTMDLGEY